MHELLTVVAHEVSALGTQSHIDAVTVSEGPLPDNNDDDVYVVVPHEYFVVIPPHQVPGQEQLARTIGFCVEHPGNETFETTVRHARRLAACVDINDDSTAELNSLGISTERFVLGYSDRWDRWGGSETKRPHDVLYLGTSDDRRSRLLAIDSDALSEFDVLLLMPPHEPMIKPRPDFFMGDAKLDLLSHSKVLLNLHRGDSRSLEWVRALEAMCNGCVVVSEHSPDFAPLRPGEHLLLGRPRTLVHVIRSLLDTPSRLVDIRDACYEMLRNELTMRSSALLLAQLVGQVREGTVRTRRRAAPRRHVPWPSQQAGLLVDDGVRAQGYDTALSTGRFSGRRPTVDGGRNEAAIRPDRSPEAIDVAVIQTDSSPDVSVALAPLLPQLLGLDAVVHLCFDGARPRELPDDPFIKVHGGVGRTGSGFLLNQVLDSSDAAELLVLGAADRLSPRALSRLRAGLREHNVDAAYGMVITPQGLLTSALPFEVERIARLDYLALTALWRRTSLARIGGWPEGLDIEGAWDVWRHLAAAGGSAVLIPRPLVCQAFSQRHGATPP
jgi:hypothetical protein